MIKCEICGEEFKGMIGWKHLKKHNITTKQYKEKYGNVVSPEFKALKKQQNSGKNNPNFGRRHSQETKDKISRLNKNRTAYNKGVNMPDEQKQKLSKIAKERNRTWHETGTHPIVGQKRSEQTKEKIKEARKKQKITSEQLYKAIETKKERGYDLAFFRGKKHSDVAKKKISETSKIQAKKKSEHSLKIAEKRLTELGYTLDSVIDSVATISCNTCKNTFTRSRQYITESKAYKEMCASCYSNGSITSNAEKEIVEFLKQFTVVRENERGIITPLEIDIFLPDFDIGVEYNGLYWHSEEYKEKDYHAYKTQKCLEKNIRLIHVFEDEWLNNSDIVKSRLLSSIGKNKRIHARKCEIREISSKQANQFLKDNHIQGTGRSNIRIGLYDNDKLVSVMTFLKGDVSKRIKQWELNRFCSLINTNVVGGANRLFNYFIKKYQPDTIISFADRRWSVKSPVYSKLGFVQDSITVPNYWYFKPNEMRRYHRYGLRKPAESLLIERELRYQEGWRRIYDCGSIKYIWRKAG